MKLGKRKESSVSMMNLSDLHDLCIHGMINVMNLKLKLMILNKSLT